MEAIHYTKSQANLDAVFAALADPTRRAILARLSTGQASVNEIAAPFSMSQPAVSGHLKVLEKAGLVDREIDKQRRPARLNARNLAKAYQWLAEYKIFWSASFDQLDEVLEDMKMKTGEIKNHE